MNLQRSQFVTVLAWIFIVLSGFASFIAILQAIMLFGFMPLDELRAATETANQVEPQPPWVFRFMMSNVIWIFLTMWLAMFLTLASSIALLFRKNWGRLLFIVLMLLGIIWMFAGLALQVYMIREGQSMFASAPAAAVHEGDAMFTYFSYGIMVVSTIMTFAFGGLFGWIIKKLLSAPIRAEFQNA